MIPVAKTAIKNSKPNLEVGKLYKLHVEGTVYPFSYKNDEAFFVKSGSILLLLDFLTDKHGIRFNFLFDNKSIFYSCNFMVQNSPLCKFEEIDL